MAAVSAYSYNPVPTPGSDPSAAQPMKSTATKVKFGVAGVFTALAVGLAIAGLVIGTAATFGALPLALLIGGAVCAAISGTAFTSAKMDKPKPPVEVESYQFDESENSIHERPDNAYLP